MTAPVHIWPRLEGVRKIAVLRPNAVGDFVFALPALHALEHAYPDAELVLVGKAWHARFLRGRPGPVDRVVEIPQVAGVGAPPDAPCDEGAIEGFVAAMRDEGFDIALQMFGGGRYSNAFLRRFGARLSAGARTDDAALLDRWVPYCAPNNRRLALLEIAALVGAWPGPLPMPELSVLDADRFAAQAVLPFSPGERLAVLQPGSTDPRRRWPAAHFAALGDLLAESGMRVLVNGADSETALVQQVVAGMRHPAHGLAGRLALGGLCGLLARAELVVANDTGPLHLALALGVPSVGIFWLTNLLEGMPLRQSGLRAALSLRTDCPVCGQSNIAARCAHDDSFVADVGVDEVMRLARTLIDDARHRHQ